MVRTHLAAQFLSVFGAGLALAEPARLTPIELPIEASALTPHVVADSAKQRFLLSWQERLPQGCARPRLASLIRIKRGVTVLSRRVERRVYPAVST